MKDNVKDEIAKLMLKRVQYQKMYGFNDYVRRKEETHFVSKETARLMVDEIDRRLDAYHRSLEA